MVLSYKNAVTVLPKLWWGLSGLNVFALFSFFVVMFGYELKNGFDIYLIVTAIGALLGLVQGLYVTFRAKFTSLYSTVVPLYIISQLEILFFGSIASETLLKAGRPDLRWFAFNTNALCMVLAFMIGMLVEARRLGVLTKEDGWRREIEKCLNYSKRTVMPASTENPGKINYNDAIWIGVIGAVNIPLLFQIYGGGRDNAIFLAAPLGIIAASYLNLKTIGPALLRILLLRKIEKEQGFRFQNADYEKIQELRRGFFLAHWLMKDYRPSTIAESNRQTIKKQNHKHKG